MDRVPKEGTVGMRGRAFLFVAACIFLILGASSGGLAASAAARVDATTSNSAFIWASGWVLFPATSAYGGSYMRTGGGTVLIVFNGTRLDWIATKSAAGATASVYVDGVFKTNVNLFAPSPGYQVDVWSTGDLPAGYHTVRITGAGLGKYVNVDAVDVVGTLVGTRRVEQTDSHLIWTPSYATWTTGSSSSYSGGSIKYINKAGSVTVNFTGVSLNLVAKKSTSYGVAKITLDGTTVFTVSEYNATTLYKQIVWSSGVLALGNHTVKIEWTGTKSVSTGGTNINLDAVDVIGALR
jgi:hypothetical protein